jgi:hypothetical protein
MVVLVLAPTSSETQLEDGMDLNEEQGLVPEWSMPFCHEVLAVLRNASLTILRASHSHSKS